LRHHVVKMHAFSCKYAFQWLSGLCVDVDLTSAYQVDMDKGPRRGAAGPSVDWIYLGMARRDTLPTYICYPFQRPSAFSISLHSAPVHRIVGTAKNPHITALILYTRPRLAIQQERKYSDDYCTHTFLAFQLIHKFLYLSLAVSFTFEAAHFHLARAGRPHKLPKPYYPVHPLWFSCWELLKSWLDLYDV
jgi:hypothetical protein